MNFRRLEFEPELNTEKPHSPNEGCARENQILGSQRIVADLCDCRTRHDHSENCDNDRYL